MKKLLLLTIYSLVTATAFAEGSSIDETINEVFSPITDAVASIVFHPITFAGISIPFIILWLVFGAVFFTIYFKFANFRLFGLAINIVRGAFEDDSEEEGEVSHFQALTTALSATVGLGNIGGVAAAITVGGPGATFWMIIAGLIGMSSKFVECTLGVKFRTVSENGEVHGGPMYYLSKGLSDLGYGNIGKTLAGAFAFLSILGSFGGGNMYQSNQAFLQIASLPSMQGSWLANNGWFFGMVMAIIVGIVIIGGIKSIAKVTDKIVPGMVFLYVGAALVIIFMNITIIPEVIGTIIDGAFNKNAAYGGAIGVMIMGIRRAAFSNEAGVGSAAIAHSAVKTKHPVSEGIVALLEPFIDTVVICTMTAIVLVLTGYYQGSDAEGVALTSQAFNSQIPGANYIILIAAVLFAFSTMVSWSYYGLQSWVYLFGDNKQVQQLYKLIFCLFVIIGASSNMSAVIDFSDCMILAMSFPNIIGLYFLLPVVKKELNAYLNKIKTGEIKQVK